MKRRIASLLFSVTMVLGLLCGCDSGGVGESPSGNSSSSSSSSADSVGDVSTERATLTVYLNTAIGNNARLVEEYNRNAKDEDRVKIVEFSDDETMARQIATEVLAGKGPDIFLYNSRELPQYLSYAKKGVFAALDPLMEQNGFSTKDYNEDALAYGNVEGTQRFFPLGISLPIVTTLKSVSEKYKLDEIGKKLSYQNYYDLLEPTGTLGEVYWFDSGVHNLLLPAVSYFIDEEKKESHFDSEKFRKAIQDYQRVAEAEGGENGFFSQKRLMSNYAAMTDGLFLLENYYYSDAPGLRLEVEQAKNRKEIKDGDCVQYYVMHDFGSETEYSAYVQQMVAINDNCKEKEKAWKFLEFALSVNTQCSMGGSTLIWGNPVNKQALESDREIWLQSIGKDRELKKFIEDYYKALEKANHYGDYAYNMEYDNEVFKPLLQSYLDGKLTLDQFCRDLDNKTGIYLKETL